MAMRPSSSIDRNCCSPRPASPSRWSAGTRHDSKRRPWVSEARHPILRYAGSTTSPGVPAGTTMVLMPSSEVRAVTVISVVIGVPELVMKALVPSITHSSPSRTARVRVAAASDPASGSVRANAAKARPASRSGSQRCFCSSVPKAKIGLAPSPTAASRVIASDESTLAISSTAMQKVRKSASLPP